MLPEIKNLVLPDDNFPTKWQTVIFRNYGLVSNERIAKVIGCDAETVKTEAARLGIESTVFNPNWEKSGYISIIRNNWFLLPYDQLEEILGFSEKKLDFALKEEDFLAVKLGYVKPECERVVYSPLTAEQLRLTEKIAKTVKEYDFPETSERFDFFPKSIRTSEFCDNGATRFVHGYITPCGDAFSVDSETYLPDSLLEKYKAQGINGIWLHGVLSTLSPYPFNPKLSEGWELRRKKLRELIDRTAKYGIKIYLYFNEPRYITEDIAVKYPKLLGHKSSRGYSLCLSNKEVREYLHDAIMTLVKDCPLGGILTITKSEYQTHCKSHDRTTCEKCKDTPIEELSVLVNNIMQEAVSDAGVDTEIITNLWAWSPEEVERGIPLLDKRVSVITVSESRVEFERGGVSNHVRDYSISVVGPGEYAKKALSLAASLGHKTYAKIQVNNSWECAAVPYLPVIDIIKEHLDNLSKIGVYNYMLSWTHGGYPSPLFNYIASYKPGQDIADWYREYYGDNAEKVHSAVKIICEGFKEYPFSVEHMYFSPQNYGPANHWSLLPSEKSSGMIGFSWDDFEKWIHPYPYDVFISQTDKMLEKWMSGIEILREIKGDSNVDELLTFTEAAYIHLAADKIHTEYAYLKRDLKANKSKLSELVKISRQHAVELLKLVYKDARIGYEASNHYYYTPAILKEKILNCDKLIAELGE